MPKEGEGVGRRVLEEESELVKERQQRHRRQTVVRTLQRVKVVVEVARVGVRGELNRLVQAVLEKSME